MTSNDELPLVRPRVWGVAALMHAIGDSLAARFATLAVRGELVGTTRAASGHCYFTIKDESGQAALRCVMFRRAVLAHLRWPADGQTVELRGRLGVFEPRGELQFVAEAIAPVGAGSLYERFLRLKAQLEAEGLFDPARKRPIAVFPQAVGVITSPAGAAVHDVLTTLRRRCPHVRVVVYPCAVQGAEAPGQIAAALRLAGARAEVQTLLLCRGGGSLEDLWAFNDEAVVRAIAASALPVIAGIGHETDVTLADFAADLRAPTPTAAAELVAVDRSQALAQLNGLAAGLAQHVHREVQTQAQLLDRATLRMARPAQALGRQTHALQTSALRMAAALRLRSSRERARTGLLQQGLVQALSGRQGAQAAHLQALEQRLRLLDPRQVLERGYAWLADDQGQPLMRVAQVSAGQHLRALLQDGSLDAEVLRVQREPGA